MSARGTRQDVEKPGQHAKDKNPETVFKRIKVCSLRTKLYAGSRVLCGKLESRNPFHGVNIQNVWMN